MVSPFETLIKNLVNLGFYNFVLPFIISAIVLYAILKKSKVLGESEVLNIVLSIAVAFMIFGFPVITGISLGVPLATFFTQAVVFIFVFAIALIVASIFYPNMPEMMMREFKRRTMIWIGLALAVGLFITSGLVSVIWSTATTPSESGAPSAPRDVLIIAAGIIIFMILIIIAAATMRKEEKE
jgi:hypothetical protein